MRSPKIPLVLWAAILKWQLSGAKFILLGDCRSQFGPAFDRWRQAEVVGNVEESQFFMRLSDCNRVNFTTYRRGTDISFFKLYTGMIGQNVESCVSKCLQQFPQQPGLPNFCLTVSNNQRRKLNQEINEELHNTHGGIWIDSELQQDNQGFWCFVGMPLVGCATDGGCFNGQLYTVLATNPLRLQIYGTDDSIQLDLCHIRNIRPAHCITFYSAQGRTLRGRVRLYVRHCKVTTTHLIVGLSRATCPSLIECL